MKILTYEAFKNKAIARLEEVLGEKAEKREINKVNGSYEGYTFGNTGIKPTLNMTKFYEYYCEDPREDEFERAIQNFANMSKKDHEFDLGGFKDYEISKKKIIPQLIGREGNEEILSRCPHYILEDLAVIFRILISCNNEGETASAFINHDLAQYWKVNAEKLYEDMQQYIHLNDEIRISSMNEIIPELIKSAGLDCDMQDLVGYPEEDHIPAFVVTNKTGQLGAGVITHPDFFEKAKSKIGNKFYMAPASIHEWICFPEDEVHNAESLRNIVSQVNAEVVEKEDQLSNSIYFCDIENKSFEKVM